LLSDRNIRRASESLWTKRLSISSQGSKYGHTVETGLFSPQYRSLTHSLLRTKRNSFNAVSEKGKRGFCLSFIRCYSAFPTSYTIAHHIRVALNRLAQMTTHSEWARLPINRIAQAVSLGLARSYIVVPGIFSLMCGTHLACAHSSPLETDISHPRSNFYTHAEESHLSLTRFVRATFESIFLLLRALYLAVLFTPCMKIMAPARASDPGESRPSVHKVGPEAAHLSRFIYNFRRWRDVSFPKPVYPLVHPAVLVETFEHGESVSNYVDEIRGNDRVNSALAHIGTHALLKMLLVDNFVHADMHPGNILVRVAQTKPSRKKLFKTKPHLIFLDVGMTAELSKNDRVNLLEFFKAAARRDGQTAAECTLRLSKRQKCPEPKAFIQEVKKSFDFWSTPKGDLVHPAECIEQLLEQGWQRKLDPDYDVMHTLQTLLLKADWAELLSYTIEGLMAPMSFFDNVETLEAVY
ncbi:protein kinase superfamily protein, partial [Striga asiatica]